MRNDASLYAVCMEKPSCRPSIQIGSATDKQLSVPARLKVYPINSRRSHKSAPLHVKKFVEEGYAITHVGVLCSAPKPELADVPLIRLLFFILEELPHSCFGLCMRTPRTMVWAICAYGAGRTSLGIASFKSHSVSRPYRDSPPFPSTERLEYRGTDYQC